jgi:large subunit ribosomal protein L32
MSTPTQKNIKGSRGSRRAHHGLKAANTGKCEKCGATIIPHHACKKCGVYKGREVKK